MTRNGLNSECHTGKACGPYGKREVNDKNVDLTTNSKKERSGGYLFLMGGGVVGEDEVHQNKQVQVDPQGQNDGWYRALGERIPPGLPNPKKQNTKEKGQKKTSLSPPPTKTQQRGKETKKRPAMGHKVVATTRFSTLISSKRKQNHHFTGKTHQQTPTDRVGQKGKIKTPDPPANPTVLPKKPTPRKPKTSNHMGEKTPKNAPTQKKKEYRKSNKQHKTNKTPHTWGGGGGGGGGE